jgi:hypothetical protein
VERREDWGEENEKALERPHPGEGVARRGMGEEEMGENGVESMGVWKGWSRE